MGMKTIGTAVLAALFLLPARAYPQGDRGDRGERRERDKREERHERRAKPQRPAKAKPAKAQRQARQQRRPPSLVPPPKPIRDARRLLTDRRGPPAAPLDERGRPVALAPTTAAPNHALIENRPAVVRIIQQRERGERQPNRYYWHAEGGVRYCHYYDAWGSHWYGFYAGPRFYWTRRWVNRWWWYEPVSTRWLYWHAGYWWWQDPQAPGSLYIYNGGSYVPYARYMSQAAAAPAQVYYSPDGTRVAQIVGDDHGAWLYDSSAGGTPTFLAELSTGVASMQFSSAPVSQILVNRLDGTWAVFDDDGKPQ